MVDRLSQFTILNSSNGKWAFDNLAQMLSRSLWVDVSEVPGDINYILCADTELTDREINSFIPIESIKVAADKREVECRFEAHNVVRPKTFILDSRSDVKAILDRFDRQRWILKYPTGCGGIHHRIIEDVSQIPAKWPRPFLIQEFIEAIEPAVYRFYCVDGDLFGFNARKFADPDVASPWVSHANGARYEYSENPTQQSIEVAKSALIATGLYDSFGAVDLIRDVNDRWYALEVGTDGIYNHVDRDLDNDSLLDEINERLAIAVWKKIGLPPWGNSWKYRE
jgi:glutathione synthase/RimK-type ligase-like ATP-grasp enzyme